MRSRHDRHGHDQLVVPREPSLWSRFFGPHVAIPAKYVIGDARSQCHGLALARMPRAPEAVEVAG